MRGSTLNCDKFLSLVSDYIDGSLSPIKSKEMEAHLRKCKKCRIFANTLRTTVELYRSLEKVQPQDIPVPIHDTLHLMIREEWQVHRVLVNVGRHRFPLRLNLFVEVVEFADKINISIEVPGIKKEDIILMVARDYVEVSGVRKIIDGFYYLTEMNAGPFTRKIKLPFPVDTSKVQAYLENGILKITLLKV
ncbi:MAG: Hsp20 family protein [Candidatus Stahlbacteria bacterium]|nr:Hsp20 family protein [Candidatus Stahlbacteria bacterium]